MLRIPLFDQRGEDVDISIYHLIHAYKYSHSFFPPLNLLNEFLLKGGCRYDYWREIKWTAFSINIDAYNFIMNAYSESVCGFRGFIVDEVRNGSIFSLAEWLSKIDNINYGLQKSEVFFLHEKIIFLESVLDGFSNFMDDNLVLASNSVECSYNQACDDLESLRKEQPHEGR